MKTIRSVLLLVLAFVGTSGTSRAADCKPLQLINSVELEPFPGDNRFMVPVKINGSAERLLLNSGEPVTTISRQAAISLHTRDAPSGSLSFNNTGDSSDRMAIADSFDMGSQHGSDFRFQISVEKFPEMIVGNLPAMTIRPNDLDLDFAAKRLNVFASDHCDGQVAYWPERPIAVVPITVKFGLIYIKVRVDGHDLMALLNTGSIETIMSADFAKFDLKLDPGSADMPEVGASSSDPLAKEYSHKFKELIFDGVTISNPKIKIVKDAWAYANLPAFVDRPRLPDLTLGMNVLRALHLYIAFNENKLYITPGGNGASSLFKK